MWLVNQYVPTTLPSFRVLERWELTSTHFAARKACCVQQGAGLSSCCSLWKESVKIAAFAHRDSADFLKNKITSF